MQTRFRAAADAGYSSAMSAAKELGRGGREAHMERPVRAHAEPMQFVDCCLPASFARTAHLLTRGKRGKQAAIGGSRRPLSPLPNP